MKLRTSTTALLVAVFAAPVFAQESTRDDFREFCQAWQGRWVGDVTWVADFPGFGRKGEKVTAYADCKTAHDGNALIVNYYGGNGSATWMVAFDAGAKQIKSLWVTSGGEVSHSTIYKDGKNWIEKGSGSKADGTKTQITYTVTITDGGNTHTWTGTTMIGGKEVDELRDVWHRVSK
jgi:hypothetical protein